jgi:hypothetical protein
MSAKRAFEAATSFRSRLQHGSRKWAWAAWQLIGARRHSGSYSGRGVAKVWSPLLRSVWGIGAAERALLRAACLPAPPCRPLAAAFAAVTSINAPPVWQGVPAPAATPVAPREAAKHSLGSLSSVPIVPCPQIGLIEDRMARAVALDPECFRVRRWHQLPPFSTTHRRVNCLDSLGLRDLPHRLADPCSLPSSAVCSPNVLT